MAQRAVTMILQIGRKRQNRPAGFTPLEIQERLFKKAKSLTGFTLIELIIVAAIIVILIAVSSPLFRTTLRDIELIDAAHNISKLIKYGQQRAIIEEKRYRLLFDLEKSAYYLLTESEEGEEGELSAEGESAPYAEGGSHPGWKEVGGRLGGYFYLPEGIKFKTDVDKITFLPNGRCNKILLYIINQKNKTIEIKTNGRAGYVEVSEVKE